MSNMSELNSTCCTPLERVRYFPRQLLTADDLSAEQDYIREKMRRHNRNLVGWGVVCGCSVEGIAGSDGSKVRVSPGYAVSPAGDEIQICDPVEVDLRLGVQSQACAVESPCPPIGYMPATDKRNSVAYVAVRYAECYSRPVRVHPAGCGCDETGCEYSRIRESFEIRVLWQLPESHRQAAQEDQRWCAQLQAATKEHKVFEFPVPSCSACSSDPWVVLATVNVSAGKDNPQDDKGERTPQVSYNDRRVLLSTQRLQVALLCLRS
jgi:hypothetical protein